LFSQRACKKLAALQATGHYSACKFCMQLTASRI
jgi:hypothetical protein